MIKIDKSVYRFVLKQNYVEIFMNLNDQELTPRDVSKSSGMCYQYLTQVFIEFENDGLIKRDFYDKKNPIYKISLTDKGRCFVDLLKGITYLCSSKFDDKTYDGVKYNLNFLKMVK